MSYRIGSFNIGGPKSFENTDAKAVRAVIDKYQLDIVAFQDMQAREDVVNDFCRAVCGDNYQYRSAKGQSADRSFAFVWNVTKVEWIEKPVIYERYRIDAEDWSFRRDPLLGKFRTWNDYEFRLINTHLFCTDKTQQLAECARITGDVYYSIAAQVPDKMGKKVFTIALGDYNLDCAKCNSISKESFPNIITVQNDATTLNKFKAPEGGFVSTGLTNNSYDHFTYDRKKVESALRDPPAAAINVPQESFGSDYTRYLNEVSDHLPVFIEIS